METPPFGAIRIPLRLPSLVSKYFSKPRFGRLGGGVGVASEGVLVGRGGALAAAGGSWGKYVGATETMQKRGFEIFFERGGRRERRFRNIFRNRVLVESLATISMDLHGFQWISIDFNAFRCISMHFNAFQ